MSPKASTRSARIPAPTVAAEDLLFADLGLEVAPEQVVYGSGPLPALRRAHRSAEQVQDPQRLRLLATVPIWWARRARPAGLSGRWLDVGNAVAVPVPSVVVFARSGICAQALDVGGHELAHRARGAAVQGSGGVLECSFDPLADCVVGQLLPQVISQVVSALKAGPVAAGGTLQVLDQALAAPAGDPLESWVNSVVLAEQMLALMTQVHPAQRMALPALAHPLLTA